MTKQRVYEIAKKLNFDKRELVDKINAMGLGFTVNNYMSLLSVDQVVSFETAIEQERQDTTVNTRLNDTVIRRRSKVPPRRGSSEEEDVVVSAPVLSPPPRRRVEPQPIEAPRRRAPEDTAPPRTRPPAPVEPAAVEAPKPVAVEAVAQPAPRPPVVEGEAAAPVAAAVAAPVVEVEAPASNGVAAEARPPRVEGVVAPRAPEEAPKAASAEAAPASASSGPPPAAPGVEPQDTPAVVRGPQRSAVILGRIDPALLKSRLAAEGKSFSPAPPPPSSNQMPRRGPPPPPRSPSGPGNTGEFRRPAPGSGPSGPSGPPSGPGGGGPGAGGPGGEESGRGRRRQRASGRRTVAADQLYDDTAKMRRLKQTRRKSKPSKTQMTQAAEHKRVIKVNEAIILSDLARQMGIKAADIIRSLMSMGEMYTINQAVDVEVASVIAEPFGYKIENVTFDMKSYLDKTEEAEDALLPRAPVVTIMGHVDHGKTSLLDALRSSNVASGEHGGITQHIGAYQVELGGQAITFLDTPGHAAFTALRARGAKATDIVILVVAADDGVMPQTIEAINHSKAAEVPILVAINKVDKPGANPDRVKQALTEYNLIPEEWGGQTQFVEVSALQRTGLDTLLEGVLLQAELLELMASRTIKPQGLVIESRLDIGHGPMATMLVQKGTLKAGDYVVAGEFYGRVRNMFNDLGKNVDKAGPSCPIQVSGLSGVPEAGEIFFVVADEKTAKEITGHVQQQKKEKDLANRSRKSGGLEAWLEGVKEGQSKELNVIIKADVQGSVEAIVGTLSKLGNDEVKVNIIHSAVGGITENDINLASSSQDGAVIVGFNVRPEARANALAEERGIDLILHSIIYDVEAVIKSALEGMLAPILSEQTVGRVEIREIFNVPKIGTIAGCYVTEGKINRGGKCRVIRDGRVIYSSNIQTLRRFKDDVKEVKAGFECGLSVHNYNDIKLGDQVEVYEILSKAAKLD